MSARSDTSNDSKSNKVKEEEEPEMYVTRSVRYVKRELYTETVCEDENSITKVKTTPVISVSKEIESAPKDTEVPHNGTKKKLKNKSVPVSSKNEKPKEIQKHKKTYYIKEIQCPICFMHYPNYLINQHVSSCGKSPPNKNKNKVYTETVCKDENSIKKVKTTPVISVSKEIESAPKDTKVPHNGTKKKLKNKSVPVSSKNEEPKEIQKHKKTYYIQEIQCPICFIHYPNYLINQHASSCGESPPNKNKNKVTITLNVGLCENCNNYFDTDFEEHIKICSKGN